MDESKTLYKRVEAPSDYEPDIGRWLWALEDTRRRTKAALTDVEQAVLDWTPPQAGNSIGTLLYHIAAVELDWLYTDVLEGQQPWTQEIEEVFPSDVRDDQGHLTAIRGVPLADHLHRLDLVRQLLLRSFRGMTLDEFRRLRSLPTYQVTPEWVLHHLMQHEAEHRGHIELLRSWAGARL